MSFCCCVCAPVVVVSHYVPSEHPTTVPVSSRASRLLCSVLLEGDLGTAAISREILKWLPFTPSGRLARSFNLSNKWHNSNPRIISDSISLAMFYLTSTLMFMSCMTLLLIWPLVALEGRIYSYGHFGFVLTWTLSTTMKPFSPTLSFVSQICTRHVLILFPHQ